MDMIKKVEKDQILADRKKRKLDEIEKKKKENEIVGDPDDYDNYGKKQNKYVENQISKINALDKVKQDHEKKVTDHNVKIAKFDDICCDFSIRHQIYDMPREFVFRNRQCYSAYFILAVIEMLKYAVKEDYESAKSEIKLIPITLEYIRQEKKGPKNKKSNLPKVMNANSKKKKKIDHLKLKQLNQKYEDSSEDSEEFQKDEEESAQTTLNTELFDDESGSYFIRFKEALQPLVKKDMMLDDMWLLVKHPIVSS